MNQWKFVGRSYEKGCDMSFPPSISLPLLINYIRNHGGLGFREKAILLI